MIVSRQRCRPRESITESTRASCAEAGRERRGKQGRQSRIQSDADDADGGRHNLAAPAEGNTSGSQAATHWVNSAPDRAPENPSPKPASQPGGQPAQPTFSAFDLCLGRRSMAAKYNVSCTVRVAYSRSSCGTGGSTTQGQRSAVQCQHDGTVWHTAGRPEAVQTPRYKQAIVYCKCSMC